MWPILLFLQGHLVWWKTLLHFIFNSFSIWNSQLFMVSIMKLIHLKMLQGMTYSVHYQPFLHLSQNVNMMYCNILSLFRILPVEQYKRPWDPVSLTSTPRDTQVLGEYQVGVGRDTDTSRNINILFQDMLFYTDTVISVWLDTQTT